MQWLKSVSLMFFINLLFVLTLTAFLVMTGLIGFIGLAGFALIFGFGGAFFSLYISKWLAKRMFKMQQITPNDTGIKSVLWSITEETAKRAGVPMPELWLYADVRPNAFATGASRNSSMIAVSTGLCKIMDESSLKGVIGHEMGHIANGDMLTTTLLMGLMNSYVIWLGNLVGRWLGSNFITEFIITIVAEIGLSFLALIPITAFSRRREYAADAFSAKIWSGESMIKALQQLESAPIKVNCRKEALATSYIHGGWSGLFATHPPLPDRIKKLGITKRKTRTFCPECGDRLNQEAHFCQSCGQNVQL